jgi:undecaprenyl-phosphate 4-deoxy-4-formamido-L-arabinose transferase
MMLPLADERPGPAPAPGGGASLSVVIPVFNASESLGSVAGRLAPVLPGIAERFEVILVNDGSADGSWRVIEELAACFPWVRGIDLERNYGQHDATLCGILHARFEYVVTMDDDLEHPPEGAASLLARLRDGYDVVYGTGPAPDRGWIRAVGRSVMRPVLLRPLGREGVLRATSFRALRTELRAAFSQHRESPVCLDVLLARATDRFAYVPVETGSRPAAPSRYSVLGLVARSLRIALRRARAGDGCRVRRQTGSAWAAGEPPVHDAGRSGEAG